MSIESRIYRCDWPGCHQTITISRGSLLSDHYWEGRNTQHSASGFKDLNHVCSLHRHHSSQELNRAIANARDRAQEMPGI